MSDPVLDTSGPVSVEIMWPDAKLMRSGQAFFVDFRVCVGRGETPRY